MNQSSNQPTIINFLQSYWAVNAAFDTALSAYELSGPQLDTLRILHEHPGASGADIARFASVTPKQSQSCYNDYLQRCTANLKCDESNS